MLFVFLKSSSGQTTCTTLGQNPTTAFPVCGTTVFDQKTVPLCGGRSVPSKCPSNIYKDINPFWYKFTCFSSGKLGFTINPNNLVNDDYDWQLFDITGHDPMEVYTNKNLVIGANWSGMYGATGASSTGINPFECASDTTNGSPTFSSMPDIIAGHNYILLVSNFSSKQQGYQLSFLGGTASITDPLVPKFVKGEAKCDGTRIVIMLNKKLNCNSISPDGSDFNVTGANANSIMNAKGRGCAVSFDTDTLDLTLQNLMIPGAYTIASKVGNDNNTLVDHCDNQMATGESTTIIYTMPSFTKMDSMQPVICVQDTLVLVFNRLMNCNSIANDGSDFFITGPSNVIIQSAWGICNDGMTNSIKIVLDSPIKTNGLYQLHLKTGSDGNTILNECNKETPDGSVLDFQISNISYSNFTFQVHSGCKKDTLLLQHDGNNGTDQWNWALQNGLKSTAQNPNFKINQFGMMHVFLTVSNNYCTDSSSLDILLPDETAKAGFNAPDTICLTDSLKVIDQSKSNTMSWYWSFGNGQYSNSKNPQAIIYQDNTKSNYLLMQVATNSFHCVDTSYKIIFVMPNCYIDVPSGFTPNGDGLNDFLYPLNAFKATELNFKVMNRWGQVVFETNDWHQKWNGNFNGTLQPNGTYVWILDYTHKDTKQKYHLKGTSVLIR